MKSNLNVPRYDKSSKNLSSFFFLLTSLLREMDKNGNKLARRYMNVSYACSTVIHPGTHHGLPMRFQVDGGRTSISTF